MRDFIAGMNAWWGLASPWILLAASLAALGIIFYLAMRGGDSPSPPQKGDSDPDFSGEKRKKDSEDAPSLATESQSKDVSDERADDGVPAPPQGILPMEKFVPPPLPAPPPSLFPLRMCYAANLYGEKKIASAHMRPLLERWRHVKSPALLGYEGGQWRLHPDAPCLHWIIAVPLTDRQGALDGAGIQQLEDDTRAFAQRMAINPSFPSALDSARRAKEMEKFCAAADVCVKLQLAGAQKPAAEFARAMSLAGLSAEDGAHVRRINSEEVFRCRLVPMPSGGRRQTATFEMDAPNVGDPPRVFDDMMAAARRASQMLDMRLTDPQGVEIPPDRERAMREQLALLARQMEQFGAPPGGAAARLIFS